MDDPSNAVVLIIKDQGGPQATLELFTDGDMAFGAGRVGAHFFALLKQAYGDILIPEGAKELIAYHMPNDEAS